MNDDWLDTALLRLKGKGFYMAFFPWPPDWGTIPEISITPTPSDPYVPRFLLNGEPMDDDEELL